MKSRLISIIIAMSSSLVAFAQTSTPLSLDERVEKLDKQTQKMEGDISQILQLLKDQKTQAPANVGAPAPTPTNSATPAAQPANGTTSAPVSPTPQQTVNLKPGAILEVWTLKPDFQGDAPTGRSIGGFIDKGEYFQLTNFIEEPSLVSQKSNRVALKWSGLFKAKEVGTYVFTIEIEKDNNSMGKNLLQSFYWNTDLSIDNQSLLKCKPLVDNRRYSKEALSFSDSAEVKMEPGYYPFNLLSFFTSTNELPAMGWDYKSCRVTVKVRGPSDMLPVVISSKDLFHKE